MAFSGNFAYTALPKELLDIFMASKDLKCAVAFMN